jgi:type I site-specific restriction endonuclease
MDKQLSERDICTTSYEVYLGLYQAITGPDDRDKIFRELSPGFFDLICVRTNQFRPGF